MLRHQLDHDLKVAMRARDLARVGIFRLIFAQIKQREVDSRTTLSDNDILEVLEKMIKQRHDSIAQFEKANRQDLLEKEKIELALIQSYLPDPLLEEDIQRLIDQTIETIQPLLAKETNSNHALNRGAMMGRVMGALRPQLLGRADMSQVSILVKKTLSSQNS